MQPNPRQDLPAAPQNAPMPPKMTAQELDDFIYLISHDVRASVRALIELPQWIAEDLDDAGVNVKGPLADSISLMNRHTGRLDRMLVDLLTFSRIGRMQTSGAVDLREAVETVLEELSLKSNVTVIQDFETPHMWLGERDALTLIHALIKNAVTHHDKKAVRVVIRTMREGSTTVLEVSDDGPGITEASWERVFHPMVTLKPRDEVEGSGMGLAMVRKIATINGGSARLSSSRYGRGTRVEVRLPVGSVKN
ncbi:MAG: HAMP domain-containing sensor histidine kinase [Pseudomonadota bacterium]